MSLPRPIFPGSTYLITRRCTQRQMLLKPTALTTQIFAYCVAEAANRFEILLHAVCVMGNHWHAVLTDPLGHGPAFWARVHRHVAKCVNASLGRWENVWASEDTCVVRLEGPGDILDKMLYTVTNPVAAGLVERSAQWPGLCGYLPEHSQTVTRPAVFFQDDGDMPEKVELRFTPPPGFDLSPTELLTTITDQAASRERALAQSHRAAGRMFLGVKGVLAQRFTATPASVAKRRGLRPRVAAKSVWQRIEALRRLKDFVSEYREAWKQWARGIRDVIFPAGTYALRVHSGVLCHPQ